MHRPFLDTVRPRLKTILTGLFLLLAAASTACSDDPTQIGNSNGSDSADTIGEMDDDEVYELCSDVDDFWAERSETANQGGCMVVAYMQDYDDEQQCNDHMTDCLGTLDFDDMCAVDDRGDRIEHCEATRTEMFDCLEEIHEGAETFSETMSCEEIDEPLSDEQQTALTKFRESGSACENFDNNCPECPDDEQLVVMDGEKICAAPCDDSDDCDTGESCEDGFCVPDDEINQLPNSTNNDNGG